MSTGGSAGNVSVGVSIMSNGVSFGTISAGVAYDSNGAAVGAVSAGAASSTNSVAAGVAGVGTASDSDIAAAFSASAGTMEGGSAAVVATASSGHAEGETEVAPRGETAVDGGEQAQAAPQGPSAEAAPGDRPTATTGMPSQAELEAAVAEAARIDVAIQSATPAQRELLRHLAQLQGDARYMVPSQLWIRTILHATSGISEEDIAQLATLEWRPGFVTPDELQRQVREALVARRRAARRTARAEQRNRREHEAEVPVETPSVDQAIEGDPEARPSMCGADLETIRALYERARGYNWEGTERGVLHHSPSGESGSAVTGEIYVKVREGETFVGWTADVSGNFDGNEFVVGTSGPVVSASGICHPGSRIVGKRVTVHR